MGGKRLRFFNFWEFLRLCWLFSWWASIGATLVATYILGNCWRYFLEQLEVREKKTHLIAMACPLPPRSAPPRPHICEGVGLQVEEIIWVGKSVPPPHAGISDLWWSPPPPTPGCEEPAGVLKIRTGNLKIDSVGVLFRKIPAFPRTCYTPSPSPPGCRGGGDETRGVQPFPS